MGTLVAYQGVLDSKGYPILWRDETVLPPTHGEMDEIWFPKKKDEAANQLEKPLGQAKQEEKRIKTVTFTRANVGK